MANRLLTKTQIDLQNCLRVGEDTVLEHHDALQSLIRDRVGGQSSSLFAEPVLSRGNDSAPASVSWYSEHEGKPRPLSALPVVARGAVESYLSDTLGPLRGLLDDPEAGPLLAAALWQMDASDVVVVNSRPVLINWGMRPARLGGDSAALSAHYAMTLGRFLPLATPPGLSPAAGSTPGAAPIATAAALGAGAATIGEQTSENTHQSDVSSGATGDSAATSSETVDGADASRNDASGTVSSSAPGADAMGGHGRDMRGPDATIAPVSRGPLPKIAWVPLVILLALASITLIWLLLPNTRLFANDRAVPAISDDNAVALAEQVNRDLLERRDALTAALDGAVCLPNGTLVTPGGRTPEGLVPPAYAPGETPAPGDAPGDQTKAEPDAILPADPARVRVPVDGANGTVGEMETVSLLEVIEERTVLVLAITGENLANGTGFIVGPGLVMTNDHVIADAVRGGGSIAVAHRSFDRPISAEVLSTLGPLEAAGGDFALLRISDTSLPAFDVHLSQTTLKLTNVIAAGFPGDVLETDSGFERLVQGNLSAMPELTVTDGAVSTEQDLSARTKVLVHSAPLSNGNSGGPLVDLCGRLVGVNTFVRAGDLRTLNFALSSGDLLAFLDGTPATPAVVSDRCVPNVTRLALAPAALPEEEAPEAVAPTTEAPTPGGALPTFGDDSGE